MDLSSNENLAQRLAPSITSAIDAPSMDALIDALKKNNLSYIKGIKGIKGVGTCLLSTNLDEEQTKAIHIASDCGSFEVIQYLLEKFPDQLNQQTKKAITPLYCAAVQGHYRVVKYLIEMGADSTIKLNSQNMKYNDFTAIIGAMAFEHHHVVNALMEADALNLENLTSLKCYWISLKWAIEQQVTEMVYSLFEVGYFQRFKEEVQISLMSCALKKSNLSVIQRFSGQKPALLSLVDEKGFYPIYWAVCRGDVEIIQYLIDSGVDLSVKLNKEDHPDHKKTMFVLAHERRHYAAANKIIHALLTPENKDKIFDFITDASSAIEYCLLDPLNAKLISKNQELLHLIKDSGGRVTEQSIGYYKTRSSRRPSFFTEINRQTGSNDVYYPKTWLGEGSNSVVRKFINKTQDKHIAIKSPKQGWAQGETAHEEMSLLTREIEFLKRTQEISSPSSHHVYSIQRLNFLGAPQSTLRSIMPYLGATTVERIIGGSGTPNDFAKIILSMLNALMSIHDKGIIHGDVKENNMLHSLSQNKTVFVDFEFSYYLTDRAASIDPTGVLWAPERRVSERPPKPHTSQDVYSFADMLRRIIGSHRQGVYFSRFFPSLCIFINKALDFTPGNRPQLSSLHTALSEELNQFEIKSNASRFPTEFDEAAYQALEL